MRVRLGYACISNGVGKTSSSRITYTYYKKVGRSIGNKKLDSIIKSNFNVLEEILNYNIKNDIYFYRMTSNLIPLATHESVDFDVINQYEDYFKNIGNIINNNNLRVDIHLDPYVVINSINNTVLHSSINILNFYKDMFNKMNINTYMIMHVGSKLNGKMDSMRRFIDNFNLLDSDIKNMIILENDDKVYNIRNVLKICNKLNIPMVLDYHHFKCNRNNEKIEDYIEKIFDTWNDIPKIHFSSPKNKKEYRAHHEYIDVDDFINFINKIKFTNRDIDIMLESKGKDDALARLVRQLKYKTDWKFENFSTFLVK